MFKIGTHDSATGEKGKGFLSWLVTPFAKTQSKTIKEQYDAGCRIFDIRIKHYNGVWRCAHGLWKSMRTAMDIISEINDFTDVCGVSLTYEGRGTENENFLEFVKLIKDKCKHCCYGGVAVKYGKDGDGFNVRYDYLDPSTEEFNRLCLNKDAKQGFLPLDGRSWHTYLPIPWLWDKIYKQPHVFTEDVVTYYDFL